MNSYQLRVADREEGTYTEEQVSQLFADGQVDRSTPCRRAGGREWKTIDDYLPMLKYGTQLPPAKLPADASATALAPPLPAAPRPVVLTDIDLPFAALVRLSFKWAAAGLLVGVCLIPVLIILWILFFALLALVFGSSFSFLHRP